MTTKKDDAPSKGRGRPPKFDRAAALEAAMKLFWERGYEGAYFEELTGAMGISPSTFYNSFGSKEALFEEAADFYNAGPGNFFAEALSLPNARDVIERLIRVSAEALTREDLPAGCMVSLAGTQVAPSLGFTRTLMTGHRAQAERALADRLQQGIIDGDLPEQTDAPTLAAYFSTLFRGMAVQARDGASREKLLAIGLMALRVLPSPAG